MFLRSIYLTFKNLLTKHKLIINKEFILEVEIDDFIKQFSNHIEYSELWFLNNMYDVLSVSKLKYRGVIKTEVFKVKKRQKMFDFDMSVAIAEGTFKQVGKQLRVQTTIIGFNGIYKLIGYFGVIFFLVSNLGLLINVVSGVGRLSDLIPFLFTCLFLVFPYLIMRDGARKLLTHLEQDFKSFERTK